MYPTNNEVGKSLRVYLDGYVTGSVWTGVLVQGANLGWIVLKEEKHLINIQVEHIAAWHLITESDQ